MGNQSLQKNSKKYDGDGSEDRTPQQTPSLTKSTADHAAATTSSLLSGPQDRAERSQTFQDKSHLRNLRLERTFGGGHLKTIENS